jgi:hypothetical protein
MRRGGAENATPTAGQSWGKAVSKPACRATTERGEPCRAFALPSGWCWSHDPSRADEVRAARSKGGKLCALQGRRRRLDSPSAVVAFLSNLVYDVAEGRQDAEIAKTLAYALNVQLKAIDLSRQSDVEAMLAEVRALTEQARRRA